MRLKFYRAVFLIGILAATSTSSAAPRIPEEAQEVYLSFSYSGLINNIVTAIYYRDSVYIPISTLFKQLKIDQKLDMKRGKIGGFFIKPDDLYEVDFKSGVATIGGKEIRLDTAETIAGQLDYYLLPSVFRRVFGLKFVVDFSSLNLVLSTNLKLPIVADYDREIKRNFLIKSPQAELIQAPLMYPMKRSLLNGGILDYSLSAFHGPGQTSYSYGFNGGTEVLGGDAEGSILGIASPNGSQIASSTFSWRYVFDSTDYITSAALGNLYSDGLTQYGFRGAQISNEPVTIRTLFGKYSIEARTKPGWDVDLYMNGSLVGYAKADSNGFAHFNLPLVYGTTFVQLKYYGPNGEFRESDRRIQVPFTFNPAGQINYTFSAGKVNNTDYNFLSANAVAGITGWLTDKVGMDYVDNPLFAKPLFYNSLSVRFSPEYMLSADAAPTAFYRSTFTALYASQASFDLMYEKFQNNLLYNPSGRTQQGDVDFYLPLDIGDLGLNLRGAGEAVSYSAGLTNYNYSGYLSSSFSQINASVGYTGSVTDYAGGPPLRTYSVTASVLYSLFFGEGGLSFLDGSLLGVNARYGILKTSPDDINFQLSKNIDRYIRLSVSADRDFVNKLTVFSLQITADLPFTRSTSTAQSQNGAGWYTENLTGSVGFDANYGSFQFSDIPWVGHSAVSMRMFIDTVGNGRYVKGDEIIKDGQVTLRQSASSSTSRNGIIRDWNLLPYTQYSADVDVNSISNPLWIPKDKSFSFVTDPDSYKRIDIPFYVGGIIEGKVLRKSNGAETAVSGLIMMVRSLNSNFTKTITVFNDGSFYYMGIPPGEYEAYVDSSQLEIVDMYSDPAILKFNVKTTKNGDFVQGLRIFLRDKKSTESGEVIGPEQDKVAPKPHGVSLTQPKREGYTIQVGAFKDSLLAVRSVRFAAEKTSMRFHLRFNDVSDLYAVQSDTMLEDREAVKTLHDVAGIRGFGDAFIVPVVRQPSNFLYWIRLVSLKSLTDATRLSSILKDSKRLVTAITTRGLRALLKS